MNFRFTNNEAPERTVEVTLAMKGAEAKPMLVAHEQTNVPDPEKVPLIIRLATGVKSYGNGVEVSVTQVELYDPTKPGDKERAAVAAFDWFDNLMKNRGGQLSQMLAEVQRVNPTCQFNQPSSWAPSGVSTTQATFAPPMQNPLVSKTYP